MIKTDKQIESKIKKFCEHRDFAPKYLKNIIIDVCHTESTTARTSYCYICNKGLSLKEQKQNCRYGVRFGQFYNKRHSEKSDGYSARQQYFTSNICMDCIGKIELNLNFEFKKSFAP